MKGNWKPYFFWILLSEATGAISGGLAMLGTMWALGFFAVLGLIGVAMARALPDVSAKG